MADSYQKYSEHHSSRSSRDHKIKVQKSNHSHEKRRTKNSRNESTTPPLPTRKRSSIDELIKQRDIIQEELNNMAYSDNNITKKKTIEANRKAADNTEKISTKRRKTIEKESSPVDNRDYDCESEDEEYIIEQRRKQRKQLLEQFIKGDTEAPNDTINFGKSIDDHDNNTKQIIKVVSTPLKETTDMFSDKDYFRSKNSSDQVKQDNDKDSAQLTDNWDDPEGYYNIKVGDIINNRYTIKTLLGQGVFANVVKAQDNSQGNIDVAIKITRNNDLIYKTGLKEIATLRELNDADPENKYHCVKLHRHFMHKGHLCLVLDSLHMDLRSVLKKYGKSHGLNMKALMSYSRQLLLALRLLKKVGIIHADIKPDNILVNEKKNVLKLCDFGSATKESDNEPTPYLVSRFYRAPEIILGLPYNFGVDLWSTACTLFELATGRILFTGSSNNKMLKCFMDLKGKIPSRLIRKSKFKDQHFNYNNNFLLHKKDEFTGRDKVIEMSHINPTRDLLKELKKHCKILPPEEEKKVVQLKDMLDKMLLLDSSQRPSVVDCLKHPFIQQELQK